MCEKLTSHLFRVKTRELLIHNIHSHSATREALGLTANDPTIIEVEWLENNDKPKIRFTGKEDQDEQQLVWDFYAKKFKTRMAMVKYCVAKARSGDLHLSGCDLKGITLPQSVGGSLDLRGCDLKGITIPKKFRVEK